MRTEARKGRWLTALLLSACLGGCGEDGAPTVSGGSGGGSGRSGDGGAAMMDGDGGTFVGADDDGPVITIQSPEKGIVVGGDEETIVVQIEDAVSGLDPSSVRILIRSDETKEKEYTVTQVTGEDDLFTATFFPTKEYGGRAQVTVNVEARDVKGNSSRGELTINLDTVRPYVALDPPPTRTYRESGAERICSLEFDPVGDDAASDGRAVTPQVLLRMLVWDRAVDLGNGVPLRYAGVDDVTVRAWVQGNAGTSLLIDKDKDGVCDEVLTEPENRDNAPTALEMVPIPPGGTQQDADFGGGLSGAESWCSAVETPSTPPTRCSGEADLSIVIAHPTGAPTLYAFMPTKDGPECIGGYWQTNTDLGWACVVGQAQDKAGNKSFSKPMRVCFSNDGNCNDGSAPLCTDGCKMPDGLANFVLPYVKAK